jgi:D-alanyl-D-alanine carboxypeptidase (penicillin-binding protein 5/6)
MGAEGQNVYKDTVALFEYGFANFQKVNILKKGQIVTTVSVKNGEEKINLLAAEDYSMVLSDSERENLRTEVETRNESKEPIRKNEVLGEMIVYADEKEVKRIGLLSSVEIEVPEKSGYRWLWIIAGFLLYRTIVTIRKIRRRKRYSNITYVKR